MNKQIVQTLDDKPKEDMRHMAPRMSDPKREKRDKVIRIRSFNYDRMAKLGDVSQDWDDVLTKLLDHWEKTKGKQT
jgi:hypothetical protein